ncbi:MAG: GGDEF domain-containing protein [Candidatus Omnitrophica bacterium]|nr:GGDEF domain-containing protein [Candidatus Omnitrophota bacterium]
MKKQPGFLREKRAPSTLFLPRYYRFAKYFILICIELFIILLIMWFFPDENISFLLKQFFPFLLLVAFFLYLFFLVVEYEAKKYLQTRKELEERNTNLNLLVMTSHKISESLNLKKIIRGGFAGLACLLPVKKGFILLCPDSENQEIAATYHLSVKTAEIISGHLNEKQFLHPKEAVCLLNLEKQTFRNNGNSEISVWQNLQILNLLADKKSRGFLILDAVIPPGKKETAELLCRQMATAMENSLLHQEVEKNSTMDPLTKLNNRRLFYLRLNEELERAKRFSLSFSIMFSDIDNFKDYVDKNGHLMGDDALQKIGEIAQNALRKIDIVARYGGDEFIYLLPQTNAGNAKNVAQRVKDAVNNYSFPTRNGGCGNLTLSIGIASYSEDAQGSDSLMERADQALFQAKSKGKNRICLYTSTDKK